MIWSTLPNAQEQTSGSLIVVTYGYQQSVNHLKAA